MNDIKKPNDEHFDDSFNEDFDFGEGNTTAQTTTTPPAMPPQGPNKKFLASIGFVVILAVAFLGYKFYFKTEEPSVLTNTASITPENKEPEIKTSAPTVSITTPPPPSPAVEKTEKPVDEKALAESFSGNNQPPAGKTSTPPSTSTPTPPPYTPIPAPTATPPSPPSASPAVPPSAPPSTVTELFNQQALPPTPPTPPPPPVTQTPPPILNPKEAEQIANLTQALDKLYHQMDYNLSQIRHLDNYTRDLSQTLTKLNETIKTMDQRLANLTNTTSSLSKDVGNVRSQVGQVQQILGDDILEVPEGPRRKPKCAVQEEPEYVVHAVIPGRAWLKSMKGQIITVTEGETVGNYGKILVIDAANGVVLTSTGFTFR